MRLVWKESRNCIIKLQNLTVTSMIKEKETHFEEKNPLFYNTKHYHGKKAQKTLLFFKNTCWEDCQMILPLTKNYFCMYNYSVNSCKLRKVQCKAMQGWTFWGHTIPMRLCALIYNSNCQFSRWAVIFSWYLTKF